MPIEYYVGQACIFIGILFLLQHNKNSFLSIKNILETLLILIIIINLVY